MSDNKCRPRAMNIAVYCASSGSLAPCFYEQAESLGKWIGGQGHTLVYGGCSLGLMESVSKGVKATGKGWVIGVAPHILQERGLVSANIDEIVFCDDLTERKRIMMEKSDIFIAMPGSIGTLDEAFSVMAQHVIGIDGKMVIFWNLNGFWEPLFRFFDELGMTGVLRQPMENLYHKAETLKDIIAICEKS